MGPICTLNKCPTSCPTEQTGLCEGNPPVTGGIPSQRASNKENISILWRHNGTVFIYNDVQPMQHENTRHSMWQWTFFMKFGISTHWPLWDAAVIFEHTLQIDIMCNFWEIALIWPTKFIDEKKPILVQVMAWCRQATYNYLNQCWLRPMSPYGVTGPQCIKIHDPMNNVMAWRSIPSI